MKKCFKLYNKEALQVRSAAGGDVPEDSHCYKNVTRYLTFNTLNDTESSLKTSGTK